MNEQEEFEFRHRLEQEQGQGVQTQPKNNQVTYVPNANQGSNPIARGLEEGGLGILQTAENMGRDLRRIGLPKGQEAPPSNFQAVIDQARQSLPQPKSGGFVQNVGNALGEAAGNIPGIVTQVQGLGGGPFGMAAQGYYGQNPGATQTQRAVGAGTNALLGTAFEGINKLQPTPEAGGGEIIGKLLARMGLSGALGYGSTKLTGGTNEQALAQAGLGAYSGKDTKEYSPDEISARAEYQGQKGRDLSQQLLGSRNSKGETSGENTNSSEALYQNIEKAKDYRQVLGQMQQKAANVGQEASNIISQNNFPVDPMRALEPLQNEIARVKAEGHQDSKVNAMEEILKDEEAKISSGQVGQDRLSTHGRKQALQDLAAKEKAYSKGEDDKTTGRQDAFRELGRGYRAITEGGDKRLSELNGQYGPLVEAQQHANARLDDAIKSGDMYKPWWSKVLHLPYRIGSLVHGGASAVTGVPIEAGRVAQASSGDVGNLVNEILKSRSAEQKLNPSSRPQLSPPMTGQPAYTPPPTRGPGPYNPGEPMRAQAWARNNSSWPEILPPESQVPYGIPYAGGAGNYSGPEVLPPQQQVPYGQPMAPQGKSTPRPIVENPHQPYGPDLPYKKPDLKSLADGGKKRPKVPGVDETPTFNKVDSDVFRQSRLESTRPEYLTDYKSIDYKGMKTYTSNNNKVGYAIKPDGDIISVFNNSGKPGLGRAALKDAIKNGGTKLDCVGEHLRKYYEENGFEVVKRVKWNDKYAPPQWDYKKGGRPDIIFMKLK